MDDASKKMRLLLAWAAIATLSGLAAIFAWQWSGASANWVAHTLIVQQLSKILSAAQDIETGQRGYLLTADPSYLEPYAEAKSRLGALQAETRALLRDSDSQQALIAQIDQALRERISITDRTIESMRQGRAEEARDTVRSGKGKIAMNQIRELIGRAQDNEHKLFSARQNALQLQRAWLLAALLATLLASSGLAMLGLLRERERVADLQASTQSLASVAKTLEDRVAQRTEELAIERDRAEAEKERAEALLRDVTHRVGNSLALVVGFINLHIRHASDPLSIKTLTGARSRIHAIASAQRRINVTGDLDLVRIDTLIDAVIADILAASGHDGVEVDIEIPPLLAPAQSATTICVLTQEFVMNSLKHAFADGRAGTIHVSLNKVAGGGSVLEVRDNGIGFAAGEGGSKDGPEGLGGKIAALLTKQFNGSISYVTSDSALPGTNVVVALPDLKLSVDREAGEAASSRPAA